MRKRKIGIHLAAVVLTVAVINGSVLADDDTGQQAELPETVIISRVPSVGGPFAVEALAVRRTEVSSGGPFRLAGTSRLKAESHVFSDGFESGDALNWSTRVGEAQFPSGAIVAFALEECPSGWVNADSSLMLRTLVGLSPGGASWGSVGYQWNGENDVHWHYPNFTVQTDWQDHLHQWGRLVNASFKTWQSFTSAGANVNMQRWDDGIDGAGSGYYLFAAVPGVELFTKNISHGHSLTFDTAVYNFDLPPHPNVQLRYCRKE